jgi:hypothetical protein
LFDDVRARMDRNSVDAAYLRRSDARSLAVALLDTIIYANFERVVDTLQASRAADLGCEAAAQRACADRA